MLFYKLYLSFGEIISKKVFGQKYLVNFYKLNNYLNFKNMFDAKKIYNKISKISYKIKLFV